MSKQKTEITVTAKKKKKKKVLLVVPPAAQGTGEQKAPFEEVDRGTPAEVIRGLARGFRLSFNGLGGERKVSDDDKKTLLEGRTDAALKQLRLTKKLFAKHPALKKLGSAKSQVKRYFEAKTIAFPEEGVRVLILEPPDKVAEMTTEELDKHYAEQANMFRLEMRNLIAAKHDAAVKELQAVWSEVVEKAQDELKSQFDPALYPSAERLPYICKCVFEGYNVELSKDWQHLSPAERERELAVIRQKFEAAIAKQEEFVVSLLGDALDQLAHSLGQFQDKKTTRFKSSVVTRVFGALDEFKKKTVKYGILKDSAVEEIFKKVRSVLREGGTDRKTLPDLLRKSEQRRTELINKVKNISGSLASLIQSGQVRRKLLRE